MRSLVLLHDAFGGFGGIAKFNRDLLTGLCSYSTMGTVTALPRLIPGPLEPMPQTLEFSREGARGAAAYIATALRRGLTARFDLVICAHINLLPLAFLAARRSR